MSDHSVAPTSPGQSHLNTLRLHTVKVCFSRFPGRRDEGISGLDYKVFDGDPSIGAGKQVSRGTTKDGIVEVPWKPNPPLPGAEEAMFVELMDSLFRVTLRGAFEPVAAAGAGLTPAEMNAASGGFAAPPNAKLRAVQQRLDLLGYARGVLDNEGSSSGVQGSSLSGRHDARCEHAILAFQHDADPALAKINGLPDDAAVLSLLQRCKNDGYP